MKYRRQKNALARAWVPNGARRLIFCACLCACLASVLLLAACSDDSEKRASTPPATLPEPGTYPTIVRADRILDPSDEVSQNEWAAFYPQVVTDKAQLWELKGRLVPEGRATLGRETIRLQLHRVEPGHFAPKYISIRTESDGSFVFAALPPAQTARLLLESRAHQLADEVIEIPVSRAKQGEVEIPFYRWSTIEFELTRGESAPIGRWVAGLRRPNQGAVNLLAPSSAVPETRNTDQHTRAPSVTVRFDRVTSGTNFLHILLPNHGGLKIPVQVAGGEDVNLGTLVVPRGATLEVDVAADIGVIIPEGLQLHLQRREATASFTPRNRQRDYLKPDILSIFRVENLTQGFPAARFDGLYEGTYILKAMLPGPSGFVTQSQEIIIGKDPARATIRLRQFGVLAGSISKSEGGPALGAIVSLRDQNRDGNRDGTFRLIMPVNEAGQFGASIPEGRYELTARSPSNIGYPRAERFIQIKSGEVTQADLTFAPTTAFRGSIMQTVHPPRDTSLTLHWRSRLQDYIPLQIEHDLTFENLAVPQGDFDLFDNHTDFIGRYDLRGVQSIASQNIEVRRATIELTPVDSKGRRVPHAYAYLIPRDAALPYRPPLRPRFANSDEAGRLEFDRVLTGDYELVVDAPGFGMTRRPFPVLTAGSFKHRVTLDPPGGSITLRLVRESDGSPVFNAVVQEFRVDGESIFYGGSTTNRFGDLEMRELPEGTIEFDVWPADEFPYLAPRRVRVEDLRSDENRLVVVTVAAASPVAAVVLDSKDEPIAGATVRLRALSPDPIVEGVAKWMENYNDLSMESGLVRTMLLPQGRSMVLVVKAPGRRELEAVVTPSGALRTIVEFKYPED